jgi:hypothetical protein
VLKVEMQNYLIRGLGAIAVLKRKRRRSVFGESLFNREM